MSTLEQLSAISVAVSSALNPPNDGMTSPPRVRIFAMSMPNVDRATGFVESPFHRISQEPVWAVCRNAIVRYLAPEALLCAAGLASVYAWKYGVNKWAGNRLPRTSTAYALPPRTKLATTDTERMTAARKRTLKTPERCMAPTFFTPATLRTALRESRNYRIADGGMQ